MSNQINVLLVEQKSRFILTLYGQELTYVSSSFGKRMVWKNYGSAKRFLMENEFVYKGDILNKDNIVITELKEQSDD